jgi:sodium-dependent dicarboxylate transporter 2/3/5
LVLGCCVFFAVLALPTPAGMQPAAQKVAATVLLMAIWWIGEALPLAGTALVPLSFFSLLGVASVREIAASYANHLIFLFLGGFFIASAIQKWGLHKRIAISVLTLVGTNPTRIVLGFMVATAFLSMWISNTATAMMMFPIAMAVVRELAGALPPGPRRETAERGFGLIVMLGVAYAASIGGAGTLIGTPPNVILAGQYQSFFPAAPPISFLQWMLVAVPIVALSIPAAWFYLINWGGPARLSRLAGALRDTAPVPQQLGQLGKMSPPERTVLVVFLLTAALWVFRGDIQLGVFRIPGWAQLLPQPKFATDATVAITMGLVLFALPAERTLRRRILDWDCVKDVPWGVLLLFGGGFAIAKGITDSGLSVWIGERFDALRTVPLPVFVLCCCVVVTLLTEITSNTAVTAMLIPVIASLAARMDAPPLLIMMPATIAASFAFVLPVATPPNAIVMGSGWVTIAQMAKAGIVLDLMGVVIVVGTTLLIGPWVF